jgi:hypothetical protein
MKQRITFALIMGAITTALISFTLIAINVGFVTHFLFIWLRSWIVAYALAFTAMIFIAPRVQLFVNYLLNKDFY